MNAYVLTRSLSYPTHENQRSDRVTTEDVNLHDKCLFSQSGHPVADAWYIETAPVFGTIA